MDALSKAITAAGSQAALATVCGVVQGAVANWKARGRVPPEYGARIEEATGVMRWELFPEDWQAIWPELVGARGAPAVHGTRTRRARAGRSSRLNG